MNSNWNKFALPLRGDLIFGPLGQSLISYILDAINWMKSVIYKKKNHTFQKFRWTNEIEEFSVLNRQLDQLDKALDAIEEKNDISLEVLMWVSREGASGVVVVGGAKRKRNAWMGCLPLCSAPRQRGLLQGMGVARVFLPPRSLSLSIFLGLGGSLRYALSLPPLSNNAEESTLSGKKEENVMGKSFPIAASPISFYQEGNCAWGKVAVRGPFHHSHLRRRRHQAH